KIVPQLIRLAADFDGHIAPMFVSHRIPPSNDGGAAPWPPPSLVLDRRLLARGLERHAEDKAALKFGRDLSVHDHGIELLRRGERRMVHLERQGLPHRRAELLMGRLFWVIVEL